MFTDSQKFAHMQSPKSIPKTPTLNAEPTLYAVTAVLPLCAGAVGVYCGSVVESTAVVAATLTVAVPSSTVK